MIRSVLKKSFIFIVHSNSPQSLWSIVKSFNDDYCNAWVFVCICLVFFFYNFFFIENHNLKATELFSYLIFWKVYLSMIILNLFLKPIFLSTMLEF